MEENERSSNQTNKSIKMPTLNTMNNFLNKHPLKKQASTNSDQENRMATCLERKPFVLENSQNILNKANNWSSIEGCESERSINANTIPNSVSNQPSTPTASYSGSSLFSSFSWKSSAGLVIDTIREKFNYFKRGRSVEEDTAESSSNVLQTNVNLNASQSNSKNVTENILKRSEEIVQQSPNPACSYESDPHLNRIEKSSNENDDIISLYDNDGVCILFENVDENEQNRIERKDKTVDNLSSKTERECFHKYRNDDIERNGESNENAGLVSSSLCSPCIGSKNYTKKNRLLNQNIDTSEFSLSNVDNVEVENNSKIVHHQPYLIQSSRKENTLNEDESFEVFQKQTNGDKKENEELSKLVNVPLVTFQTASPYTSITQGLNLGCSFNENETINKDSATSFEPLKIVVDRENSSGANSNTESTFLDNQPGINIWSLRNSLEQTKIEIQCPTTGFEDFERSVDGRRLSVATDCVTEASPLSTPSSDLSHFHGKSISDSDDEGRPFIVTSSGRLSPRRFQVPNLKNPDFSQSICQPNTEASTESYNAPLTENSFDSIGLDLSVKQKNSFLTKATIENQKYGISHYSATSELESSSEKNHPSRKNKQSSYAERRSKILQARKWTTFKDEDVVDHEPIERKNPVSSNPRKPSSFYFRKQKSLPLLLEHESNVRHEDNLKHPNYSHNLQHEKKRSRENNHPQNSFANRRGKSLRNSSRNSITSDDVFLSDIQSTSGENRQQKSDHTSSIGTRIDSELSLNEPSVMSRGIYSFSAHRSSSSEITSIPPTPKTSQRPKFRTKFGSAASSETSSSISPISTTSEQHDIVRQSRSVDMESDDSAMSNTSRSSTNLKNLTRFFRRNKSRQRCDSAPIFCGYTMDRDYCVDPKTDRIFKEFLCQPKSPGPIPLPSGEPLPPPSHMVPPPPLKHTSGAQLRRQVMRKQYSDTIAMYYGQRQKKWRFSKQKSDSINYPVGRGTFRRQERIDEDFDPEEINERLSSTSSRRESEKPEYVPPTVSELKEWRQSSEDRNRVLHHATSLPVSNSPEKKASERSGRRVTFEQSQLQDIKSHLVEDTRSNKYKINK